MAVGRINEVAALTGFSYEKMYGRFVGTKNIGRSNELAVRWGSTVADCKINNGCSGKFRL